MSGEFERRKNYSLSTLHAVRERLNIAVAEALPKVAGGDSISIYATGSFGRQEATEGSDLDAFIAEIPGQNEAGLSLSGLDQKVLIGRIIEVVRSCSLPDLDRDGEFIKYYSSDQLVKNIGLAEDEVENTFTARLLLLLESESLLSDAAHTQILQHVINTYWRDFEDYPDSFRPTFLLNDILKYWRVLCVDYESKMTQDHSGVAERRQTRRVKNLKLRYNRMMTCFSTVAALCDEFERLGSVSPDAALAICAASPIGRLEHIAHQCPSADVSRVVSELKDAYNSFLEVSSSGKDALVERLRSDEEFAAQRGRADEFGRAFFELIRLRSSGTDLFRYLIV